MTDNAEGIIKQPTAEFNGAGLQISRIGELLKDTHSHSRAAKLGAWNSDLDRIWVELAGDLEPKLRAKHKQKYLLYAKMLFEAGPFAQGTIKGFKENELNTAAHLAILQNKEIWLRNLQNDLGKGTKWKDDAEDDWE